MTLEKQSPTTTTFEAIKSFSDDRVVSIEQTHELARTNVRCHGQSLNGDMSRELSKRQQNCRTMP